jgi:hypothetical protein
MRLTKAEKLEADALQADGWTLHRNGWPDFLAEKDGKFRLIEVKQNTRRLSAAQKNMCHALFRFTGLKLEVKVYKFAKGLLTGGEALAAKRRELRLWAEKYRKNGP